MGIVWETYDKGVPLLGVPENSIDSKGLRGFQEPPKLCQESIFFGLDISENSGTPQIIHLFIGISIIFTIHFRVALFLETPI